ncbi:rRNA methyltransferase 2, mitochondrial-like isoform X2 [Girardinichthys multiradiatus]|uniref:rRNA methyltransferase 2, mitochondrial-like isoform X2 n=1 Tax=Girardinichthys multiradiatus TaxID=208333 RepID=UPI001FACF55D|nr:rRNA methyltransferase 2, mitochondrial-like isoform X2 [Girardinichthys multiradiatus]
MWGFSVWRRCIHCSLSVMKKLKGKTAAEQRWVLRQLKDPYVKASHAQNFRCRSAFKLLEIDDKFRLLQPGYSVVDCGAAPGAWSQVAVERVNSAGTSRHGLPRGTVIGIDLLNIPPLDGAHFLSSHDVTHTATHAKLLELLPQDLAEMILLPRGSLLCKYWDGVLSHQLQEKLSSVFHSVRSIKPDASRKDSAERYFLARMYKKPVK